MRYTTYVCKNLSMARGIQIGKFKSKKQAIEAGANSHIKGYPLFTVYDSEKKRWLDASDGM